MVLPPAARSLTPRLVHSCLLCNKPRSVILRWPRVTVLPPDTAGSRALADSTLYFGDNLEVMQKHLDPGSVDLVYLDPPFNSNRNYNVLFARHDMVSEDQAQLQAFGDTWRWTPETELQFVKAMSGGLPLRAIDALRAMRTLLGENDGMAYLVNMAPRLVELHRLLKSTGSLYLHCDPTMSHYLKVLLDAIFGPGLFRSEIVWRRYGAHNDANGWSRPRRHPVLREGQEVHVQQAVHGIRARLYCSTLPFLGPGWP